MFLELQQQGKQPGPNKLTADELRFAGKECNEKWLATGAVEQIDWREKHPRARVCNVVVAYRRGAMDRLVWAGQSVNEGVEDSSFRMEQIQHIMSMVEPQDWAFSLDFEKGFHQIPLDQSQQFMLFYLRGNLYKWKVLPMGLRSAPKDFSFIVKQVLKIFRQRGIRCAFYIDDVIFLARSRQEAVQNKQFVLAILYELKMRVSLKKSLLNPGQLIEHLGCDVCTDGSPII